MTSAKGLLQQNQIIADVLVTFKIPGKGQRNVLRICLGSGPDAVARIDHL
jgi:hypothetical protein